MGLNGPEEDFFHRGELFVKYAHSRLREDALQKRLTGQGVRENDLCRVGGERLPGGAFWPAQRSYRSLRLNEVALVPVLAFELSCVAC